MESLPAERVLPVFAASVGRFSLFFAASFLALWWWDRRAAREIDRLRVWNDGMTESVADPDEAPRSTRQHA